MWIATRHGFFSVVSALQPDQRGKVTPKVQIRARTKYDLERLQRFVPQLARGESAKIIHTPSNDYPYRIIVDQARWVGAARQLALEAGTYGNFKNTVAVENPRRAKLYERVWALLQQIELEDPECRQSGPK